MGQGRTLVSRKGCRRCPTQLSTRKSRQSRWSVGKEQGRCALQSFEQPVFRVQSLYGSFGDGLNRLFGIALSLVNAKDGLLLNQPIREAASTNCSAQCLASIFKLARRLDIQVFATSHSWDSIEAFQKAAAEDPDEGVLIRLSRSGADIIPTLFREESWRL